MPEFQILDLFQGIATLAASEPKILFARIFLIFLGFALIYLGKKGVLEALLMIPMGLGMAAVNAGVLFFEGGRMGTLFLDPLVTETDALMNILQINWLQPIYTFTFSNGLIACLVFLGIGTLLDVGFVMQRPFRSMFLAICAEAGTLVTFPMGVWLGLSANAAAATSTIGGADGPMVLFTALVLAPEIFVPITVVGYLYLGLCYGGYPYLIKLLIPKSIRGMTMPVEKTRPISSSEKLVFAVVTCVALCLLFPVAAPLLLSVFLGVVIRESGLTHFYDLFSNTVLYGATFFLGLLLGVLCEANTILDPTVLILLILGHDGAAVLGARRAARRLHPLLPVGQEIQSDHRYRGGKLRADDRQSGAKGSLRSQSGGDRAAARTRRQCMRRDHIGRFRRRAYYLAPPALKRVATMARPLRRYRRKLPRAVLLDG